MYRKYENVGNMTELETKHLLEDMKNSNYKEIIRVNYKSMVIKRLTCEHCGAIIPDHLTIGVPIEVCEKCGQLYHQSGIDSIEIGLDKNELNKKEFNIRTLVYICLGIIFAYGIISQIIQNV